MQRHPRDVAFAETAISEQPFDQFAADHTGRAKNQNMQMPLLLIFIVFSFVVIASEAWQSSLQRTTLDRFVALRHAITKEPEPVTL
jgi:hypothetical protein